ncbi:MAG: type IX secretion system sortase PorU [Saprospiraceae bacterium]
MRSWITLTLLFSIIGSAFAQSKIIEATLEWEAPVEKNNEKRFPFENAAWDLEHPTMPLFIKEFPLEKYGKLNVEIIDVVYETLEKSATVDDQFLSNQLDVNASVGIGRREAIGRIQFIPIIKTGTGYQKVKSFKLKATVIPAPMPLGKAKRTGSNSVLVDGDIYKIAVTQTGIHRLTYDFLKNTLNINIDNIDPRTIKIYGNGGGMLPEANSAPRIDDLEENAIMVAGESDGKFDAGDYILFYGEGANEWTYNEAEEIFIQRNNAYDTKNHYFIKIGTSNNGKRVATVQNATNPVFTTNSFNGRFHYEKNEVNLLDKFVYASASGREWFGESFKFTTSHDFRFNVPNVITSEPVKAFIRVAGRSISLANSFNVFANNQNVATINIGPVNGDVESSYAKINTKIVPFSLNGNSLDLRLDFNKPTSDSEGWLDYISINARQSLTFGGGQLSFRDIKTIGETVSRFEMANSTSGSLNIWDVTNPTNATAINANQSGNQVNFNINTIELKEFIAFDGSSYYEPSFVQKIANQNLHGTVVNPELVILYHKDFVDDANRLATHRSTFSNMNVYTVDIEQVYNEFSSGNQDVSAIRDFSKYLYENYTNFKYLLLFGDGSFDYKNINASPSNQNFIPVYETANSTHPIGGFVSDDYYALLDPEEGSSVAGKLDIGVGRIPARTAAEAKQVVDKIIKYDTDPAILGDWKNRLTFAADDEDGNTHVNDGDQIAVSAQANNPIMNLDKIYFDAFPQVSTHGGTRFPDVTDALNSNMFKGHFVMNYMGHGGEEGWAQERVLQIPHIQSWKNENKLPLFVTATCSFAPYDDPSLNSAGEMILLKPDGGAIALFTTVRAVYTTSNKLLTNSVFNNLFKKVNGVVPPMGEILRYAKNISGAGTANTRKFALLGDPSQTLAYPKYNVVTTSINGQPVSATDTLKALQQVTIEGYVADNSNALKSSFNGVIYPTVFDKRKVYKTLGQDAGSNVKNYTLQKTVLFKGRASVTNGKFKFTFIVPKDIDYDFGQGKISYYADNGNDEDAAGSYENFMIGGTSDALIVDDEGPKVEVYMNTEEFVFGGITDESPTLLVLLEDDNGINTSGTGIGHDLTGVLNDNTQGTYVLNDFYESELDDFKKGVVRYPLADLAEGRHTIKVKAWDVANNSGEGSTEFVVASSAEIALDHVLNYPNPFTTSTEFQFEHNLPNEPLVVQVQIFTVSGQLVKTIQKNVQSDGYRVTGITWDGTDDFGGSIGRGVYVYKVSVGTETGSDNFPSESKFEKLVILK